MSLTLLFVSAAQPLAPSRAALHAIRSAWLEPQWGWQAAPASFVSGISIPPYAPLPEAIWAAWVTQDLSRQPRPTAPNALAGDQPPPFSLAAFYTIRLAWPEPSWSAQSEADSAGHQSVPWQPQTPVFWASQGQAIMAH